MRAGLNLAMLVPTGKTPKGDWLFEPVHGNGHHWGIGFGFDANITLWRKDNNSIEFMIVGDYKYLFQGIEKRTLDYYLPDSTSLTRVKGGRYVLAGEEGKKGVFPFANVLTQDIKVTPASQFDGIVNFNVNLCNFVIDFGYNFFVKEQEEVHLNNAWQNDKYAIADIKYDATNNFLVTVAAAGARDQAYAYENAAAASNAAIQNKDLIIESVRSPNTVSHKLYAGFGYQWNKYKYPVMLGIAGSYEFVQRNSSLENWAIWLKLGISW